MRDYQTLDVWKKAHQQYMFVKKHIVSKFPKEERFELNSQLLRASLSVPLNIVEGCGKFTDKDFARYLDNALGSANEVHYCCYAAFELGYITEAEFEGLKNLINDVKAMLVAFLKRLRENEPAKNLSPLRDNRKPNS